MTLRFADLSDAIARNDVASVVAQLRGAAEPERRKVNASVQALVAPTWDLDGTRAAAAIAVLGTASGVRQVRQSLAKCGLGTSIDEAVAVLSDRAAHWTAALPAALLAGPEHPNLWRLARGVVRAGLAAKPDAPEYTTRMPQALALWVQRKDVTGETIETVETALLADPDLLTDEVFRLFRVEGAGRSLYHVDNWLHGSRPGGTWRATLARLAKAGAIDYGRLLDECINVFLRDFPASQLSWYVGMHAELAPTLDDTAARWENYARLLAADASVGVGLAQTTLEKLVRAGRLDYEGFIAASSPALFRTEKGNVLKQLKLLGLVAKQRPDLAPRIAEVISPALDHERPEIREAAFASLAGLPHGVAPQEPAPRVEAIGAALRDRSPVSIGPGARLSAPISDPEEVLEAFTRLIEDARDPLLVERALAGAVRTACLPVARRKSMAEPLAKRALEQLPGSPWGVVGGDVRAMVASVAFTWATGVRVGTPALTEYGDFALRHLSVSERMTPVTPTGVFAVRANEAIGLIVSGASAELLSEPTHHRGAVDPDVLVERARRACGGWPASGPPRYDLELAALRLIPSDLRIRLDGLPRRVKDTLADLLDELPATIEPTVTAGRFPDRWGTPGEPMVLAQVTPIGRDAGILRTLTNLDDSFANYERLGAEFEYGTGFGASIATWPLVAPWHPELIAAHLLRPLSRGLRPGKPDLSAAAIGCLAHPRTPLGPIGHLALALGCNGAEGDVRTIAGDVFALAAKDGRLDPRLMAEAWLELARAGVFLARRADATLRPLVAEPPANVRLAQTLQLTLGPLVELGTRDAHVLLRLAAALTRTCGVFPEDSRLAELAERRGSSALVAAARAVASARGAAAC